MKNKEKKALKEFELEVPIFKLPLVIVIYNSPRAFKKWLDPLVLNGIEKFQMAVFRHQGKITLAIENDGGCKKSMIVHEAVHIKNKIFIRVGAKNSLTNDEVEAYLVQWLVEEITKIVESEINWVE